MPRPTTRVLAVLELLQSQGLVSGSELARRIEVDARTLRRYISALEEMGIPITTEQGRHGGYRLVPGYKLPPMMFNEERRRRFRWPHRRARDWASRMRHRPSKACRRSSTACCRARPARPSRLCARAWPCRPGRRAPTQMPDC
jgi:predicted DNA-binding transcriptional regulator YafY